MTERITVLLVDDHAIVRAGLRMLIESQADMHVVGDAACATEALALAIEHQPTVTLVDLTLGGESGLDLIRRLRTEVPATRSVALTMHDDAEYLREVLAGGGSGYVLKEAAHTEVLSAVRVVSQGRAYISLSLQQLGSSRQVARALPDTAIELLSRLTVRERAVLRLIAMGLTHREIGAQLGISLKTVETHRQHVCEKLGMRARAVLVRFAHESGLIETTR